MRYTLYDINIYIGADFIKIKLSINCVNLFIKNIYSAI